MAHHHQQQRSHQPQQPLLPRLHLFEINDQPWFPSFLRERVQDGLTHAWTTTIPLLQPLSPANIVADLLLRSLGPDSVPRYTFIDFCSGAGGPTPSIERQLNRSLLLRAIENKDKVGDSTADGAPSYADVAKQKPTSDVPLDINGHHDDGNNDDQPEPAADSTGEDAPSYAEAAKLEPTNQDSSKATTNTGHDDESTSDEDSEEDLRAAQIGVDFILTDLHPHLTSWEEAARNSARLHYVAKPINAASAPEDIVSSATSSLTTYPTAGLSGPVPDRQIFRLYNLAFHHFDDTAARAILSDTLSTSSGFGIFELQDRSLSSFIMCLIFGVAIFFLALPLYWWSPTALFFVYIIPIVPFVLVFDGIISGLRTRTPSEIEALLRTCGNKDFESGRWEIQSGRERFFWPTGYMSWTICTKKEDEDEVVEKE